MTQTINYLRLSTTDSDELSVIEAKQGDNQGDICQIEIYNNQDIVDLSQFDDVLFTANKPDRSSVVFRLSDAKNLIKNGNILSLTLTDALLSMHGTIECELSFYKGKVIKSTYNFNIYVFKSPGSFDVMNESDINTIKNGISEIRDIRDEVKKSEENTKESENNAKISETNAKASEINAANSADTAKTKANEASASASAAKTSEQNAKASEIASSESEANALNYAKQASDSKDAAKVSETNVKKSEQNAAVSASTASAKANESSTFATLSKSYAIGGTNTRANEDTDNSKYYKEQASLFSSNANTSATKAKTSENNAANSANIATAKASAATTSASNAATSESSAKNYADQASASASTATSKATIATNKAQNAETFAQNALNYSNQAKEYKDKCLQITQGLEGALIPMGTITFAELPTQDLKTGYMYNISNEFTSDNRFKDGNSKIYPAGTNIYYTQEEKWDVLVGDLSKYAFKIDFESHKDNKSNPHGVTKAQVGLENVPNVTTNNQTVTYSDTTTLTTLSSGEKLSVAFSKIKKAISDLISHIADTTKHITSTERTLWNTVENKVDKINGKGLSSNDYTTEEKNKLKGIATEATAVTDSVVSGWGYKKTDTNTWRGIQNNLTSSSTTDSLSAAQGKVLKGLVDGKAASGHTHTKAEVGLGNVDNTADNKKSVNYANSAGYTSVIGNTDYNKLCIRGYTGTPLSGADASGMFLQPDFTNSCINVGINGLGNIGVNCANYAKNAGTWDGYSNDMRTQNNSDTWLLVVNNKKIQHRMATDFAMANHTHADKLNKSGDTMSGTLNMNGNTVNFYSNRQYIIANEQDLNLIACGNRSGVGYINARMENAFQVRNTNNSAWKPINASAFYTQSSKRYKENITNMPDEKAKNLLKYRVVMYDYINKADGVNCEGMIAEEVAEIDEYPVYETLDGTIEGLDYSKFVPQMIKMIQIQQQEIDELRESVVKN